MGLLGCGFVYYLPLPFDVSVFLNELFLQVIDHEGPSGESDFLDTLLTVNHLSLHRIQLSVESLCELLHILLDVLDDNFQLVLQLGGLEVSRGRQHFLGVTSFYIEVQLLDLQLHRLHCTP